MKRLFKSFGYAIAGLRQCMQQEKNFQWHIVLGVLALVTGFLLHISAMEWLVVSLCIGLVLAMEMLNTVVELLCNLVQPDTHSMVKHIKDISAGAVLIMAIAAFASGCIIFIPKILLLFKLIFYV